MLEKVLGKSLQSLQDATVFIARHADSLEQIHRRIDTSTSEIYNYISI